MQFLCSKCSKPFRDNRTPNPLKWYLVHDTDVERLAAEISGKVAAGADVDEVFFGALEFRFDRGWTCDVCKTPNFMERVSTPG